MLSAPRSVHGLSTSSSRPVRGISTSSPRRRRDPPPRTIHVVAAAAPRTRARLRRYANQKWVVDEVVDRGFANAETPGFWVAAENERRPRLQCFRCGTSLETIDRFPGKNFFPPHGNGGWLINHKGQGLFYREGMRMSDEADDACFVAAHVRSHYAAR